MGALFLEPLDEAMAASGHFYARFMDDWVILAPTRWKLRQAIRRVNEILALLRLQQHPDKTFIGRISHGFDFLGFAFSGQGLSWARPAIARLAERLTQLCEQDADSARIGDYVQRWLAWTSAGLSRTGECAFVSAGRAVHPARATDADEGTGLPQRRGLTGAVWMVPELGRRCNYQVEYNFRNH
jgi:RNA-directed DNA polymerase